MVDATISRPGCAVWRVWAAQVPADAPLTRRARGHVRFTPSAAHRYRHVSASGCRRAPDGQPTPRACDLMASTIYGTAAAACALATAAAVSITPYPSSGDQAPAPEAVCSRISATCRAVRAGLAAQTSAAAPATCGAAKDVPLP